MTFHLQKQKLSGLKINIGWWLKRADNIYPKSQWELVDGKWYYLNIDGYNLGSNGALIIL